jgi:hypothetical protein
MTKERPKPTMTAAPPQPETVPASTSEGKKRTTVFLDPRLVERAIAASGASNTSDAVERGLLELVRKENAKRLADLAGADTSFAAGERRKS